VRVWITRSEPGASRQAEVLKRAGHEVIVAPVLTIEPTSARSPAAGFRCVIFLSEHAVRHGGDLGFCAGARVLAVGATTARALAEAGIESEVPAASASEGLIELLAHEALEGAAVLIVAGEGGRKTLRDTLIARGARVSEFLCYRRRPLAGLPVRPVDVDAVLVGSQDGFRSFARLWFDGGGGAVRVIAASERIAGLGTTLGFPDVEIATGPAAEDWMQALERRRNT